MKQFTTGLNANGGTYLLQIETLEGDDVIRYGVSLVQTGPADFHQSWYTVFEKDGAGWRQTVKSAKLPDFLFEEISGQIDRYCA